MTITKETASKIAYAHSEIEAAEGLLKTLADAKKDYRDPDFRDAFGRTHSQIELGIPSGESSRRCYRIGGEMAAVVLEAHIHAKRAEIEALCLLAKAEMEG